MHILGIDVGGSGIKGATVDTKTGVLTKERQRIKTPQPATPEKVTEGITEVIQHFNWKGPVGIGFPAVVQHGVIRTASNIDDDFIGKNIETLVEESSGCPTYALNDADAAGLAELTFGAGKPKGVVLVVTVGTGIGLSVFSDGVLLPNCEGGHLYLKNGSTGEEWAADSVRKAKDLNWKRWAKRFNTYLKELEKIFWPDLLILGGGVSKKMDKFEEFLSIKTPIQAARLKNEAGIVGASLHARINHN